MEKFPQLNLLKKLGLINLLFILGQVAVILVKFNLLPAKVPLFYSLPWGDEQLVPKSWLFLIPFLSLVLAFIHFFWAKFLQKKDDPFFSFVLLGTSLLFALLGTLTLIKIVFLVS
ncbi:MAG: hypothetical protein ACPLY7_00010 [Microgenomates group bacterium]